MQPLSEKLYAAFVRNPIMHQCLKAGGDCEDCVILLVNQNEQLRQPIRLGCAGLIRRGDRVLLGKRNKEPNRGFWVLPGGGVEFGESFAQTLEREVLEEAGIEVTIRAMFKTYELINPPNEHRVIVYLVADHRSGEPVPSSDLSDCRFFTREELKELREHRLISPFVEEVLREASLL